MFVAVLAAAELAVGALAAGLPADQRRRVILIGIGAALVLRVIFAAYESARTGQTITL